jgi:hydroxymethylbilane synthase
MRGNLHTRFKKFDERHALSHEHPEHLDGMLLAFAGVHRLGLDERISQVISHDEILPAVGQGALAIEIRIDDDAMRALVASLNDPDTELCTKAERSLLRHLEGGCQIPIGAYASLIDEHLTLSAFIGTVDGKRYLRSSLSCILAGDFPARLKRAEQLGMELGETLLANGGRDILSSIRS